MVSAVATVVRALVVTAAALALHACQIDSRSGDFRCERETDCPGGRDCVDGWCVVDPGESDAGGDGATSPCTRFDGETCLIDCLTPGACSAAPVQCPGTVPCAVTCSGTNACALGVSCGDAAACTVTCDGPGSCAGQVACGGGACTVTCGGAGSCAAGIACGQACACDTSCAGDGACAGAIACPGPPPCTSGGQCTTAPSQCDRC